MSQDDTSVQRTRFVALLRTWMASKSETMREMECLVAGYARNNGVTLKRRELATQEEVMAVQCPRHGWAHCWNMHGTLRRGCLVRQIEALRCDYLPRLQDASVGALDDGSSVDTIVAQVAQVAQEVHHGA